MKKVWVLLILLLSGCSDDSVDLLPELNISHLNVIAHRGVSRYAPENSLKAIERTLSVGVDIVEFDVQSSKDSIIMIFHDDELFRMTGNPGRIMNYTKKQIQNFYLKDKNGNYTDETIPTLEDVFNTLGDKIEYYIEIKESSHDLERKLIETIQYYQLENKVSILSFNNKCLKRIAEMNSGVSLRLLIYESNPLLSNKITPTEYEHLNGIILPHNMVTQGLLKGIRQWIDDIDVFTLDSVNEIGKENYQYLTGIITDNPEEWVRLKKH